MLLRANTLAKGYSGARVETVELLVAALGAGLVPHVPSRGSVGASGDLAPLAHLALPLVGEGEAIVDGARLRARRHCAPSGSQPIVLAAKEGLSLINGTQFMTAMASLALVRAQRLAARRGRRLRDVARGAAGHADELPSGDPRGAAAAGQMRSAATLRALLDGSAIVESHRWCDKVQDAYSLRCAPQVHGASRDLLDHVARTVAVELNAATDNPLVLVDEELIVSNGNFHGQPIAMGLDCLAIACAELGEHLRAADRAPRQPVRCRTGCRRSSSRAEEGLNSGFMIPQYVAAALVSENKSLCHPGSVDSIPTSAGQEDHVSMGNGAGLKALQVLANAERVLAIELLAGAQAVEFLAPLEPGVGVRAARAFVRTLSERVREDRPLSADIERVAPRDPRRAASSRAVEVAGTRVSRSTNERPAAASRSRRTGRRRCRSTAVLAVVILARRRRSPAADLAEGGRRSRRGYFVAATGVDAGSGSASARRARRATEPRGRERGTATRERRARRAARRRPVVDPRAARRRR